MLKGTAVVVCLGLSVLASATYADPDKDESGHGKQRYEERKDRGDRKDREDRKDRREERRERDDRSYFHQHRQTRIPNGHLPPPGECRIWYPDRPAGHQPPPFRCDEARGRVEVGGWLISPGSRPQEVEVAVYDTRRPGIVIDVGIFDARTGSMVRIVGAK